eukprot:6053993-Pyramimonas_sp.AAC.1
MGAADPREQGLCSAGPSHRCGFAPAAAHPTGPAGSGAESATGRAPPRSRTPPGRLTRRRPRAGPGRVATSSPVASGRGRSWP